MSEQDKKAYKWIIDRIRKYEGKDEETALKEILKLRENLVTLENDELKFTYDGNGVAKLLNQLYWSEFGGELSVALLCVPGKPGDWYVNQVTRILQNESNGRYNEAELKNNIHKKFHLMQDLGLVHLKTEGDNK